MEEIFYILVGVFMYYSWIHFAFIQHSKVWKKRTNYEKIITVTAMVFFVLFVVGTLM